MIVEQIYTKCLAEASYYIESNGEAVIIDPLRETQPYIDMAAERGATIKYVLETHFHADFVSGHVDLAQKTGATIVYGPNAKTSFTSHIAADGEVISIGNVHLKVLHTPGHTPESTCYLLKDEAGKDHSIFTGDTLFIGDVGRPDLAIPNGLTTEDLAGMLFDSLRNKIMPLADEVIVYPAHGAGSACGKNMSSETFATLGNQKQTNYALNAEMTREAFIKELTTDLPPMPQYFPKNAAKNQQGYDNIDTVMERGLNALTLEQFEAQKARKDVLLLDTRHARTFLEGFIPGAWSIGLNGSFAVWVGNLISDLHQPILLVCEVGKEEETVRRLARVGYDNAIGYLEGGFATWQAAERPIDRIPVVNAAELERQYNTQNINILDVRKSGEFASKHVEKAELFSLDFLRDQIHNLDKTKTYYVHCASGFRSVVATSIMRANGYENLIDVEGGIKAIEKTDLPINTTVCASTLR